MQQVRGVDRRWHPRREEQQVQRWRWERELASPSQRHDPASPKPALASFLPLQFA